MTDKTIMLCGDTSSDCFYFKYLRSSPYKLEHYLKFDPNDYWIYKSTGKQKEVSYQDFLDFKHCGYIFYRKNLYSNIEINKWIEWFIINLGGIKYINRPLPPIEIIDKIKIKK